MLRALPLLLLLPLTACGGKTPSGPPAPDFGPVIEIAPSQAPIQLAEDAVLVLPPTGRWHHKQEVLANEQWYTQYRSEDGRTVLRAFVFPTQQSSDPVPVLMQAVDTFFRSVGVEGFGLPTRKARSVWGAPAAEATVNAAVEGVRVDGAARLLLTAPGRWAFAVGYTPHESDGGATDLDVVLRFVRSLEPGEPRFYARVFRSLAREQEVAVQVGDEEPLRRRDLDAILLLIQAGAGARLPLASEKTLRDALTLEARSLSPEGRAGYRQAAAALEKAATLPADEREAGMRGLGARMLQGLYERANSGDSAAMQFATAWQYLGRTAVGAQKEGLNVGQLASLNELSAFLASIAADEDVTRSPAVGTPLTEKLREELAARWADLPAADKEAYATMGGLWAHLRRAWDEARPEDRAVFRRALVAELADPGQREAVNALDPGRPLMAWIEAQRSPERPAELMRRAHALGAAQRAELIDLLAVERLPYAPGW